FPSGQKGEKEMSSLILRTTTNFLLPVLLLFSLFLMLRGHNDPGGGFSGGLVAASAFVLYAMAFGVPEAIRAVRVNPRVLIGAGLLVALGAGLAALPTGRPLMTSLWWQVNIFGFG